jgi:hypothetical protein
MKAPYISALILLLASAAIGGEQSNIMAKLEPGLQQALLHDAACRTASSSSDQAQLLQVPVRMEEIVAAGRDAGVIAAPLDACHCDGDNCKTYVYLRSSEGYLLTMQDKFASLHPMKVAKHGLPSLSGKLQVSQVTEETTVYDWDGKRYRPSLCATVTRHKNQKLPVIARHACRSGSGSD